MPLSRRVFLGAVAVPWLAPRKSAATTLRRIRLGVCIRPPDFAAAEKYPFDFVELPAAEIAAMSADEFQAFKARVLASPLRCLALNNLIRSFTVVGENRKSSGAVRSYLSACLPRCRELGASIVVWGSAGSWNVPAGYPRARAWAEIAQFLAAAGDIARQCGLLIAVEPLSHPESNIINTAAEALRLVRAVNHSHIRMVVDYYHLRRENEDPEIIFAARHEIVHFHFANPHDRRWPQDPGGDPQYRRFLGFLKRMAYQGGISIEGRGSLDTDAPGSLAFFRQELAV